MSNDTIDQVLRSEGSKFDPTMLKSLAKSVAAAPKPIFLATVAASGNRYLGMSPAPNLPTHSTIWWRMLLAVTPMSSTGPHPNNVWRPCAPNSVAATSRIYRSVE